MDRRLNLNVAWLRALNPDEEERRDRCRVAAAWLREAAARPKLFRRRASDGRGRLAPEVLQTLPTRQEHPGMASATPTVAPPQPASLNSSLERNIHASARCRRQEAASATFEERIAGAVTSLTGSMRFVYLHVALLGAWILVNLGLVPGVPRFDPSFVALAMAASVEAIFPSTFVLTSQNRMSAAVDMCADLDLHTSLPAGHELTKLAGAVDAIAARLGVRAGADAEMEEVKKTWRPRRRSMGSKRNKGEGRRLPLCVFSRDPGSGRARRPKRHHTIV